MESESGRAAPRPHLRLGQKLSIFDQDVDAHQMMELAGPTHLRMGGPMRPDGESPSATITA